jgi:hypothetical protein
VCVGQSQRIQVDGNEFELGVLDAVIVKDGNLSSMSDRKFLISVA